MGIMVPGARKWSLYESCFPQKLGGSKKFGGRILTPLFSHLTFNDELIVHAITVGIEFVVSEKCMTTFWHMWKWCEPMRLITCSTRLIICTSTVVLLTCAIISCL